jgi:hypothetical protein
MGRTLSGDRTAMKPVSQFNHESGKLYQHLSVRIFAGAFSLALLSYKVIAGKIRV